MLDIKWIREQAEAVQTAADRKGIAVSVAELLACDEARRKLLQQAEQLRQQRNKLSAEVSVLVQSGFGESEGAVGSKEGTERRRDQVKAINAKLAGLEAELAELSREWKRLMLLIPNIVSPDTPDGRSDADNVEVRRVGEPRSFGDEGGEAGFRMKDHIALGELHGMIDIDRGVKTAGSRSYYLKGAGVQLHRAVQQLALDLLVTRGYTLLDVPLMVRGEAFENTGFFPLGEEQTYRLAEGDKWLVGTSEVPLVSYYGNEIVDVAEPIRLAAVSTCFRSEVGSAGKDVHGLYRVHQFAKVEQVVLCEGSLERSEALLQEITGNAEQLLQLLELPYRVMAVCTGDMSQKTYKQFDIETWMPSRSAYGETHSSSNLLDFQARRSNIRFRDPSGKLSFCYTLNNTAVASPRILIPLLENHQEADGSIRIPAALQPYMSGLERLVPGGRPD
jgi:seryl-tRNA synthetase